MSDNCVSGYVWNYQAIEILKERTGLELSMSGIRKWGLERKYGIVMIKVGKRWAIKSDTIPDTNTLESAGQ